MPTPTKRAVGWLAVCATFLCGVEAVRTTIYKDVGGVPTVCIGETEHVDAWHNYTTDDCLALLQTRLERDYGPAVDRCITHPLPVNRKAAYVSVAYNIGITGFCRSSIVRLENAGDATGACKAIGPYNKIRVNGVLQYSKGLDNRRTKEIKLCLTPE